MIFLLVINLANVNLRCEEKSLNLLRTIDVEAAEGVIVKIVLLARFPILQRPIGD